MFKLFVQAVISTAFIASASADIVLYTDRPTDRMQVVADMYLAAGGEPVTIIEAGYPQLLAQLQAEGDTSPADVIFVKDGVYLAELSNQGFFAPFTSPYIEQNVEPSMKDAQNRWTFITYRARTLVYDASVDVSSINTYADLANPEWAGTLCVRTSKSSYNEGLVAGLINGYGYDAAKDIVTGILANRPEPTVYPNDTAILNAIAAGDCVLGLSNSYYLGILLSQQPNLPVKIKFLSMNGGGVHANGTGAGVAATSQNKAAATKFIEFLLTNDVQTYLSSQHFDYPAKAGLAPVELVKNFGPLTVDSANWSLIGDYVDEAKQLMTEVQYE